MYDTSNEDPIMSADFHHGAILTGDQIKREINA